MSHGAVAKKASTWSLNVGPGGRLMCFLNYPY